MVANNHEERGDDIAWCIKVHFDRMADFTQTWCITPQGGEYWSLINNAWIENHRQR